MSTPPPNPSLFAELHRLTALSHAAANTHSSLHISTASSTYDTDLHATNTQLRRLIIDDEMAIASVRPLPSSPYLTNPLPAPIAAPPAQQQQNVPPPCLHSSKPTILRRRRLHPARLLTAKPAPRLPLRPTHHRLQHCLTPHRPAATRGRGALAFRGKDAAHRTTNLAYIARGASAGT